MWMKFKTILTITFSFVILISILVGGWMYHSLMTDKTKGHSKVIQIAKNNGLKIIEEVSTYYSDHVYYIVKGQNENNKNMILFISKDNKEKIKSVLEKDGLTKEEVLKLVHSFDPEKKPKKIISFEIGYDDSKSPKWDIPVWEVRYIDQQNRYTYFFVSFTDPKVYKAYSIQQ